MINTKYIFNQIRRHIGINTCFILKTDPTHLISGYNQQELLI